MSDMTFTEALIRGANPRPGGSEGPHVEWSSADLLSHIENRSMSMETQDLKTETDTPWWSGRGLMIAAAAAVIVVLVGVVVTGLFTSSDGDVVEPTPTTTPTTVPATTVASTTAATTTTVAPQAFDAQSYSATVTWNGEACDLQGPAAARAGDTLELTYVNTSDGFVDFEVFYLVSGSTVADLDATDGVIDRTAVSPPSFIVGVDAYPGDQGGLAAGESASQSIELGVAREHSVSCFGGQQPPAGETQTVKSADVAIPVVEKDQPLPAQAFDPQSYAATVTWNGAACDLQGPAAARAGDTLELTYVNTSDDFVDFVIFYLVSGSTVAEMDAFDGVVDRAASSPPSFIVETAAYPGDQSGLAIGESASQSVELRVAREHSVSCFGGQQPPAGDTQTLKTADVAIPVVDKDQPLP
ncbi:MAG: hypothetical protein KJN71_00800 [Acidimicrobiia bacterium]|nr:hypothetical protein [Acidimicrobiia bacterium]